MKINSRLLQALESRGLSKPTLAQSSTWPVIDSRKNVLLIAPTGVGKTEVAKQLSNTLGIKILRFDMSEYMERHTAVSYTHLTLPTIYSV